MLAGQSLDQVPMTPDEPNNSWRFLRLLTPILVTINLFILGQIWIQVSNLNAKIFHHQTNAEIHFPRSEMDVLRHDLSEMRREIIKTIRKTQ